MNKQIILWDIENIHFDIGIQKLEGFFGDKKIFVHNDKYIPLKENKRNYLLNQNWEYYSVKNKKNAADNKISSLIEKYINDYDSFIILTQDHGFSKIIVKLLRNNKKVFLITNNKNEKLLREIESKEYNLDNLTIL